MSNEASITLGTPIFVKIMTKNAMTPSSGEPKVPYHTSEESFLLVPRARYMYTCIQKYFQKILAYKVYNYVYVYVYVYS